MRVWQLHTSDGVVPDSSKFAQLLSSNATDVVWNGHVSLTVVENLEDEYQPNVVNVGYIDDEGNPTIVAVEDGESEE